MGHLHRHYEYNASLSLRTPPLVPQISPLSRGNGAVNGPNSHMTPLCLSDGPLHRRLEGFEGLVFFLMGSYTHANTHQTAVPCSIPNNFISTIGPAINLSAWMGNFIRGLVGLAKESTPTHVTQSTHLSSNLQTPTYESFAFRGIVGLVSEPTSTQTHPHQHTATPKSPTTFYESTSLR